jgi:hypothetical protein
MIIVVGVGATGSIVCEMLARLGLAFEAYDYDIVEKKNVINQIYTNADIGKLKIDALKEKIKLINTDLKCKYHNKQVNMEDAKRFKGTVFLLVDSMKARKEISFGFTPLVENVIETRLGTDTGRVLTFKPSIPSELTWWKSTLFEDEVSVESACGTVQGLYFVASQLASLAITAYKNIETDNHVNDLNYGVYNYFMHSIKL